MRKVKLVRKLYTTEGTKGWLLVPGISQPFYTMENPWLNNKKTDSCIPLGTYICKPVNSPRFGKTIEVTSVPSRSHILFHAGNSPDDTDGCILIGLNGSQDDKMWISNSRPAVSEFLDVVGREPFELEITDDFY
jgi:hypothetical protein